MTQEAGGPGRTAAQRGLCELCAHASEITTTRGSSFVLCALSRIDRRYPRYPGLPILRCPGFELQSAVPDRETPA